jgi:hypothetical protein
MPTITVTGADERTSLEDLLRLTRLSPVVEIGLLYTETPEGRNRYPRREWLKETVEALGKRCAVHICGGAARKLAIRRPDWLRPAGRVQVNGDVSVEELFAFCRPFGYAEVITQHAPGRTGLCNANPSHHDNPRFFAARHSMLVDATGGRGKSPQKWGRPNTWKPVGFAGGLGPDNLAQELPKIAAVARDPWWVDMEGKLRDEDDWFSAGLAEKAICTFLEWGATRPLTLPSPP